MVGSVLVLLGGLVIATLPPSSAAADVDLLELLRGTATGRMAGLVVVLVEEHDEEDPTVAVGRAEHQGPDVDGVCLVRAPRDGAAVSVGSFVEGVVVDAVGVDLVVEVR